MLDYSTRVFEQDLVVAFSPDPSLLLAGNEDSLVRVWDIRDARIRRSCAGQ